MRRLGLRRAVGLWLAFVALAVATPGCGGGGEVTAPAPDVPDLRLGMSIAEAKDTLGQRFRLPSWHLSVSADCNYFEVDGGAVSGLVISSEIATVDFEQELSPDGQPIGLGAEGPRGLRAGQAMEQAIELFGRPDRIASAESSGGEMILWRLGELDGDGIFLRVNRYDYIGAGKNLIGSFEIGLEPYIFYGEGCA
jgi:hypothetical protein